MPSVTGWGLESLLRFVLVLFIFGVFASYVNGCEYRAASKRNDDCKHYRNDLNGGQAVDFEFRLSDVSDLAVKGDEVEVVKRFENFDFGAVHDLSNHVGIFVSRGIDVYDAACAVCVCTSIDFVFFGDNYDVLFKVGGEGIIGIVVVFYSNPFAILKVRTVVLTSYYNAATQLDFAVLAVGGGVEGGCSL